MLFEQVEYIGKEAEYSIAIVDQSAIPIDPYPLLLLLLQVGVGPSVHELSHYLQRQPQHLDMPKAQLRRGPDGVKVIPLQAVHEGMDEDGHIVPKHFLIIGQMIYKLDDDFVGGAEDVDLLQQLALDERLQALLLQRLHHVPHRAVQRFVGYVGHVDQLFQDSGVLGIGCRLEVVRDELEQ